MSTITNPDMYSTRCILLLSQLLHINGIKDSSKLESCNEDLIQDILSQWKNHASTKLDPELEIKVTTRAQLRELYGNLLSKFDVSDTVELANHVYFFRVDELQADIAKYKSEFTEILNE
ncbi:uncharacterized protein SPAPADRAFT_61366 [Spathaspora passalidarum NRRL Y-27907]|uniref:Uncharacterized protein n=1 Tax=Spathaspora passalidarum (strain NRRL Y-27907 / 11-Y1) TaxID=619300 RepID=G3APW3_SPAPN|nr:uncharacterized protein SPAPADRAFT_61366 [Spathaspora passalidarum NRRL Y-27907]EGW32284.1 hypothetical protein SPAPADRAFT_61366 [Spathaspora passalidarum NRRL Y-27907]